MVPFVDLKAQYNSIRGEVLKAIEHVLETCQFTLGAEVAEFEKEFAVYAGARYGIGVNSGTSALHLALLALDIGPGDEVITVPFTFVATVSAIHYSGAKPVLVDVDGKTFNMDPAKIEAAITPRTRAIMPVHLHGRPADMTPILKIAERHGLAVIEDAAQAHGAEYHGKRAGSFGRMACFSFYPGKNLGAYGEAGIVVTDDEALNRKLRMLRDWGAEKKYEHVLKGYNYRMEGVQGAVLRVKMRYIEAWTEARRAAAERYAKLLAPGVRKPVSNATERHVYHVYAIRTDARAAWMAALQQHGIHTGIHYPIPVHLLPAFSDLGYGPGDFPESESASREVLSLPMFPELTEAQSKEVANAVNRLAAGG